MLDLDNAKELYINGKEVKKLMIGNNVIWEKRSVRGILLSSDKSILSALDNDQALLTAQLVDGDDNPLAVSGKNVDFYIEEYYNDNVSSLTFDLWDYISSESIINIRFTEDINFNGNIISFWQKSTKNSVYYSKESDDTMFSSIVPSGKLLTIEKTSTGVNIYIDGELVITKSLTFSNWQQFELYTGFSTSTIESVESVQFIESATTDSNGVATVSYSSQSVGDISIVANNGSVFSNKIYITDFVCYDNCTSDKTNKYGQPIPILGNSTCNLSYNQSENAYLLSGNGGYFAGFEFPNSRGLDNVVLSIKFKLTSTSPFNQLLIWVTDAENASDREPSSVRRITNAFQEFMSNENGSTIYSTADADTSNYYTLKVAVENTQRTIKIYNSNDELLHSSRITEIRTISTFKHIFGLQTEQALPVYIKEIKVKKL